MENEMTPALAEIVERGRKTLFGEPVRSGDRVVVPVARVASGAAGGRAGFAGRPLGYIEVSPDGARWVPFGEAKRLAAALAAGVALGWALCRALRPR